MNILAITQARYGSSRFSGKVLKEINGKSLLELHITRIKQSKLVSKLKVATTNEPDAIKIEEVCKRLNTDVYKGSLDDVLERFYLTAKPECPDWVVRLTSDCPLIDPAVIDGIINFALKNDIEYASNTLNPTFPDGIDVEVFKFSALSTAYSEAVLKSDREHVTPYIWRNSTFNGGNKFKSMSYENKEDFSSFRLTVDKVEDFLVIENLVSALGANETWEKYVDYLKQHKEILSINKAFKRNEGYQKSLIDDKKMNMGKGQELYNKAKKFIPGGTQLLSKRPEMFLPDQWPAYYDKSEGCEVWDLDGNKYIDASYMGIGACVLGYAHPTVNQAVIECIKKGSMNTLNAPEEVELAELMCKLHPWSGMVRYTRSGGEAMMVAVRIARAKTKKDKILFCGYHGWHDWYLAANLSEDSALDGHLLPGLSPSGVPRHLKESAFPFNYNKINEFVAHLEKHKNNIAAVVMESIRNDYPETEFINVIRSKTKELGIVMIFDEITAGWRLNVGGAHLLFNVEPDIAVFGKAISNGFPMGLIMGRTEIMQAAQDSFISSTYWTERIGPVASISTIKFFIENKVHEHLIGVGNKVQKGWTELAEKNGLNIEVGGILPLSHFNFKYKESLVLKSLYTQKMLEQGFLATTALYASYAHKEEDIQKYLVATDIAFKLINEAIQGGNAQKYLKGPVCHSGFKRLN